MRFLKIYRKSKNVFIRPRLHWFFGLWWKEGNLPVWRRGPQIRLAKNTAEYNAEYNFAKLIHSSWTELGKKNHPILSKIFKRPIIQLPYWMSFYFFDNDIMYKTKWEENDFRYEFPAHITLVFFGLAISVTASCPKVTNAEFLDVDSYWESILTYQYYNGDLKKTNDTLGYYTNTKGTHRWAFNPDFLKNIVDRDDLIDIQQKTMASIEQNVGSEGQE